MHDILPPKAMSDMSRELFKFKK